MLKKAARASVLAQAVASVLAVGALPVHAAGFNEAVTGGEFKGSFRPRFEFVDQEGFDDQAMALTLRAAFKYTTAAWNGMQLRSELEVVGPIGGDTYNSTQNGKTQYPIIADPAGGHFNRLFLFHKGEGYEAGYGQDEIIYDNSRWVGNIGWRQNHQTFNSLKVDGATNGFSYHAAYLFGRYHVANIKGKYDGDAYYNGDRLDSSFFLNGGYGFDFGKLAAYWYSYEFDSPNGAEVKRTNTYGASLAGAVSSFVYRAEFASQKREDAKGTGSDGSATYYHLIGGMKFGSGKVLVGYEVLGSDDGAYAVQADFGTNHKFNGFADQFLATPSQGVKDLYVTGVAKFAGVKLVASYHNFKPDDDSSFSDYGNEIDLVLAKKMNKQVGLLAKYANYMASDDAGNPKASDVQKLILQATYAF